GAMEFVDLENDALEDVGEVHLVFDVIGGAIANRSAGVIRAGGTLVTIAGPPEARPADGLAVGFVVESDRAQLGEIVRRVRDGRLRTNIGNVATLDDAVAAFNPTGRISGQTIIRVRPRATRTHRCTRPAGAVQIGWLRPFHPCNISTKETNDRGDNSHESDRGDGPGCGNGWDDAGGAARAAGSDQRPRRSGSCVGIRPD